MHHSFDKILPSTTGNLPPKHTRLNALRSVVLLGAGMLVGGFAGNLALAQEAVRPYAIVPNNEGILREQQRLLREAEEHLRSSEWEKTAQCLKEIENLPKPEGDALKKYDQHQETRKKKDEELKKKLQQEITKTGKQAKAGKLVSALQTLRMVERIGDRYGLKKIATKGIEKLAKMKGYEEALQKVKTLEAAHARRAAG